MGEKESMLLAGLSFENRGRRVAPAETVNLRGIYLEE